MMKNHYQPDHLIAEFPAWRYADFEQRAYQLANAFQQQQIRAVALWLEDAAHLACTLLAAWHANVKTLFVPNLTPESLQWANELADLWLCDDLNQLPEQPQAVSLFADFAKNSPIPTACKLLFDFTNQTELLMKTSGSTGEAKTIVKTAEQMWISAEVIAADLQLAADNQTTAISSVSIQHIYGLTVQIMMGLVRGWRLGRKQQFYPEHILAECQKRSHNVLISSPAMLSRIHWETLHLPNLSLITSSGGALSEQDSSLIRQKQGCPVVEIYGSTETGPIAFRQDVGLWTPMQRTTLGQDEQGALWIEADWVSERQQTADAVEFLDGAFALLGRIDRIVKVGDKRTSLVSVEQDLNKNELVSDCYIGQYPAQQLNQQRLAAWVELNAAGIELLREQGRKAVVSALRQHLAQHQDISAIPRYWRFTDKLPRNSQSKISKLAFNKTCLEKQNDPIWQTAEKSETEYRILGKVPLDLSYFAGHFANFPLVPGVVELQWITDQIAVFFGKEIALQRVDNLKFQKFLRPNDCFELCLHWEQAKNRVKFQLQTAGENCASGFAVLA